MIEKVLAEINLMSAVKKRENILNMLHKLFSKTERFETEIKKYQNTIML